MFLGAAVAAVLFAVLTSDFSRIWAVLSLAVTGLALLSLVHRGRPTAVQAPDPDDAGSLRPTRAGHRVARRTALWAAGVTAAAAVVWPIRGELAAHARALPLRPHHTDYVRGPGRAETAIDAFLAGRGDPTVADVSVYPRYVLFTAPTSLGASTYDTFEVRGGRLTGRGPATIPPDPLEEFSVQDVTWATLPELYEQLSTAMRSGGGELRGGRWQIGVRRSTREDTSIGISVTHYDDYRSGTLIADQDGALREIG